MKHIGTDPNAVAEYIAWQSVETGATFTAVAGNGYPVNTTAQACTVTLPAAASVGDTIEFTDYARNFATNALTIDQNSLNYQGNSSVNPVYDTDGESISITYMDSTKGWVPTSDGAVADEVAQPPTGGTITTPTGYRVHTFTSSGDFVLYDTRTIEYLIVGGGGSGGWDVGGGGGAGGMLTGSASKAAATYGVVIGAGAVYPPNNSTQNDGEDTTALGLTAVGGGAGGNYAGTGAGLDGGSGGGGGGWLQSVSGGSGTTGQGNDGGDAPTSAINYSGGGGGGAGGVGANETSSPSAAAGIGLASSITGSEVTYAVGGQGGNDLTYGSQADGEVNKGGGGDGAGGSTASNGGSGVVVLRYTV
jgi:hypothetical protein